MTFIVILIALLIERFFDWSHLRHWHWYASYARFVVNHIPKNKRSPYLSLAATVVPLLALVVLIQYALTGWLYGFATLLFDLFVFIYCLGPRNLWADSFACINALAQGDAHIAADKLKSTFGMTDLGDAQAVHRHLLNAIFVQANQRVFAVIFWFAVLGPVGALLYRVLALSSSPLPTQEITPEMAQSAHMGSSVLDWAPVRLLAFVFALGGHFTQVLACWSKNTLGLSSNEALLTECGTAALGREGQDKINADGSVEKKCN